MLALVPGLVIRLSGPVGAEVTGYPVIRLSGPALAPIRCAIRFAVGGRTPPGGLFPLFLTSTRTLYLLRKLSGKNNKAKKVKKLAPTILQQSLNYYLQVLQQVSPRSFPRKRFVFLPKR